MAEDRTASKKSTTKKAATKKSAARKTAQKPTRKTSGAPRAEAAPKASGARIAEAAARQLGELTDKDIEGVIGLQKTDDGWQVELEVLELSRIPTTTDVLASYELTVDSSGELQGYRRVKRYVRGQAEAGG
jgi:Gas vesicle synthesis protein GvpO